MKTFTIRALSAPCIPVDQALQLLPETPAFLWDRPGGRYMCGSGIAHYIDISENSPARFHSAKRAAISLFAAASIDVPTGAPSPLLFGGCAFHDGGCESALWKDMSNLSFMLPRWSYIQENGRAWLYSAQPSTDVTSSERATTIHDVLHCLESAAGKDKVSSATDKATDPVLIQGQLVQQVEAEPFCSYVRGILHEIALGNCSKVVAAAKAVIRLHGMLPSATDLVHALANQQQTSTRFLFARNTSAFFGASPETLVTKEKAHVRTMALAGSLPLESFAINGLLAFDRKNRHEHELVIREIERCLRPFCDVIDRPGEPQARELPSIVHLHTPIAGRLKPANSIHILDLIAALHPTPAVGGLPWERAMAYIADNEHLDRGWYASPIGWFDTDGNGDFAVALRCGLYKDGDVHIFSGAGIVAGSDPQAEYEEVLLKQRTMIKALGVGGLP